MFKQLFKHYIQSFRYLSCRKIVHLLVSEINYQFGGSFFKNWWRPVFISVEPADFCQLRCPQCPVGISARNQGSLADDSVVFDTIQELKSSLIQVIFYFQGEPLLNPQLSNYIQAAHKANIYTSTSTNGMLLNSENARKLVESGLDKLIVSVDGASQEIYEKYRVGGKLERALEGIKYVQAWKKKLNCITPYIEMQFIVFGTNEHQINEIKALAKKTGADGLKFKTAQIYNFEKPNPLHTTTRYSRYKQLPDGTYQLKSKLKNKCRRLMRGAVLTTKAEVLPCCFDKNAEHAFGVSKNEPFLAAWKGAKAQYFRTLVYKNRKQIEICKNCTEK